MGRSDGGDTHSVVSTPGATLGNRPAPPFGSPRALPLVTTPGHLVRCAQQVHSALWYAEFGKELTSPQYAVLSTLSTNTDIDQRTAGELASLEKSNIADVVRRLERRGWLTRVRDANDARRNLLHLTEDARARLVRVTRGAARVQATLLEPLEKTGHQGFLTLFRYVAYGGRDDAPAPDTIRSATALQLSDTPGHLVRRTEQIHHALWFDKFGTDVTSPQYAVISALLGSNELLDQRTAGDVASLDKSSIADVVRRLERRGWLHRVPDSKDGRRRLLQLTPAAIYAVPRVTAGAQVVQRQLLAPLRPDEENAFITGLAAIARVAATTMRSS